MPKTIECVGLAGHGVTADLSGKPPGKAADSSFPAGTIKSIQGLRDAHEGLEESKFGSG